MPHNNSFYKACGSFLNKITFPTRKLSCVKTQETYRARRNLSVVCPPEGTPVLTTGYPNPSFGVPLSTPARTGVPTARTGVPPGKDMGPEGWEGTCNQRLRYHPERTWDHRLGRDLVQTVCSVCSGFEFSLEGDIIRTL